MSIALRYALRSDVGLVRANNQDSGFAGPNLLIIADGMGGHAGGDVASSVAVATLAPLADDSFGSDEALKVLERTIEQARQELIRRSEEDPELNGMGTTVTAVLRAGNKLAMAHMGDSRAYLLRDSEFTQVTTDHTFVQHLVDTGKITPEEADVHPQRSVVMRVLGDFGLDLTPDLSMREARPGDRWLLCSDGLCGYVSHSTMQQTLQDIADPDACVERLIQLALRAGGPDNITCIVADVLDLKALPNGIKPTTGIQIAGSAALNRDEPTSAQDGPAKRAAALVSAKPEEPTTDNDDDAPTETEDNSSALPPRRRRRGMVIIALLMILALLGGGAWLAYEWTQKQYYLGISDQEVWIFQGIPQTVGPWSLSTKFQDTGVELDTLPSFYQERLEMTMPMPSLTEARAESLRLAIAEEPVTPTTDPSVPTAIPSATPEPSDPESSDSAAGTPQPDAKGA